MPTIAIVGAGPGLGLSIAKTFGAHGFSVALVSRTQSKLDQLADQLTGVASAGFAADVLDPSSVAVAFDRIKERFGPIDVLEYSPAPVSGVATHGPIDAVMEDIQPQLDYYLYGGIAATRQVLPEMIKRDSGTVIYTTGGSSMEPLAGPVEWTATTIGSGALRTYALKLHQATEGTGVSVAHVPIFAWIGSGPPEAEPDAIAQHYWDIHNNRLNGELPYRAM